MRIKIPFNTTKDKQCYTLTTRYGNVSESNFIHGNFPMTGIAVIENPTEEVRKIAMGGALDFSEGLPREMKSKHSVISLVPWSKPGGDVGGISPTLTASSWEYNHFIKEEGMSIRLRMFTPRECYRMMDVPEECINRMLNAGLTKYQHYKLAGNSIVVACLVGIIEQMVDRKLPPNHQLTLF